MFGPEWGNPSLRSLVETEVPDPISLAPQTAGWGILLLLGCGLLIRGGWRWRQGYLRDQYRREALAQLTSIREQFGAGNREVVRELAPLLRATAIAAAGRETIVGLEGAAYVAALTELAPSLDPMPVEDLKQLAYAPLEDSASKDVETLVAALERWVHEHQVSHA